MTKANNKTSANTLSVDEFLQQFSSSPEFEDLLEIDRMMQEVSGHQSKMWGTSIVGYGEIELKYESGRELDWFYFGFSPRKQNISLYLTCDLSTMSHHLEKLGKYKNGKGCLYIKKLADVDKEVLKEMCKQAMLSNNKH
ncbi:DUF1801 domain-containing protein [bacterium]|nr:MAG: DUF1801 domain-containing protein [bacterium]